MKNQQKTREDTPADRRAAAIERRFQEALARVRAERWRLSEEDIHRRRGSPFGRPDADDEAA